MENDFNFSSSRFSKSCFLITADLIYTFKLRSFTFVLWCSFKFFFPQVMDQISHKISLVLTYHVIHTRICSALRAFIPPRCQSVAFYLRRTSGFKTHEICFLYWNRKPDMPRGARIVFSINKVHSFNSSSSWSPALKFSFRVCIYGCIPLDDCSIEQPLI